MSFCPGPISAITLFVEDLDAARTFYAKVFGLPVHYEDDESAVFAFGSTLVNLLVSSAAPEVIEPATVAAPDAGNRFQLNFRNHRKVVVTDGHSGWIGGHNVGNEYLGLSPRLGP